MYLALVQLLGQFRWVDKEDWQRNILYYLSGKIKNKMKNSLMNELFPPFSGRRKVRVLINQTEFGSIFPE